MPVSLFSKGQAWYGGPLAHAPIVEDPLVGIPIWGEGGSNIRNPVRRQSNFMLKSVTFLIITDRYVRLPPETKKAELCLFLSSDRTYFHGKKMARKPHGDKK